MQIANYALPKVSKKQSNNKDGYPSDFVPKEEKEGYDWNYRWINALYTNYRSETNRFSLYNRRSVLINNRKYSRGLEGSENMKSRISSTGNNAYLNLDWNVSQPIPKFVDQIVGNLSNQDYYVSCNAIDDNSLTEKDKARRKLYFNYKMQFLNNEFMKASGGESLIDAKFIPENEEEIDIYMELNYKQAIEIIMENSIRFCLANNKWDELKRKLIKDMVDLNIFGVRVYYDENDQITIRYVDPVNLVTTYSVRDDFSDSKAIGEVILKTIDEIAIESNGAFSEAQLFDIANKYAGNYGNSPWNWGNDYFKSNLNGARPYASFKIPVLEAEYKSINRYKYEKKSTAAGGYRLNRVPIDYTPPKKSKRKREIITRDIECIYKASYIADSPHIYNYGMEENLLRERIDGGFSSNATFSYVMRSPDRLDMESKSRVERVISSADQIKLMKLKMQQIIAAARPKGVAVNVDAVSEVFKGLGMEDASPLDVQDIFDQIGTYYYSQTTENGIPTGAPPIFELENGMSQDLERLIGTYNSEIAYMREVLGVNDVADGSAPSKDTLVGIEKMRLGAYNNNIRDIQQNYIYTFKDVCNKIALMTQDGVTNGFITSGLRNAIGETAIKELKLNKDKLPLAQFGIFISAAPTEMEKEMIEQNLQTEIKNGTLTTSQASKVRDMYKQSPKLAERILDLEIKKNKEAAQQEAMAIEREKAKIASSIKQQEAEAKIVEYEAKAKAEIAVENIRSRNKIVEIQEQAFADRQLAVLKGEVDEALINEAADPDPSDNKVNDSVAGKIRVGNNNRAMGNAQTNTQAQKGNRQGSGGRGSVKPAQAPRVGKQPQDDAQNRVKPQI